MSKCNHARLEARIDGWYCTSCGKKVTGRTPHHEMPNEKWW